jgi:hypothetical protein
MATNNIPPVGAMVVPVFILAVLSVAARTYSRRLIRQSRNASDFTIIAGLVFTAALTGMVLWSMHQILSKCNIKKTKHLR